MVVINIYSPSTDVINLFGLVKPIPGLKWNLNAGLSRDHLSNTDAYLKTRNELLHLRFKKMQVWPSEIMQLLHFNHIIIMHELNASLNVPVDLRKRYKCLLSALRSARRQTKWLSSSNVLNLYWQSDSSGMETASAQSIIEHDVSVYALNS